MRALSINRALVAFATAAAMLVVLAFGAGNAKAYEIFDFSVETSTTQAGGHPDVTFGFRLENRFMNPRPGDPAGANDVKDLIVDLPTGMIGSPHAYPRCSKAELMNKICAADTQIGMATPDVCIQPTACLLTPMPIYNLEPGPGQAALIGFTIPLFGAPVYTSLTGRTESDYGLVAETIGIEHVIPIRSIYQSLWGVPADPKNDLSRYANGNPAGAPQPSNSPEKPFLQNPTTCGVPLVAKAYVTAYNREVAEATFDYPPTDGCGQLSFNPSLSARPTTTEAESPTGLEVDLVVPQEHSATTPAPSQIETVEVKLPTGIAINPNAADGKRVCTDVEARIGSRKEAQCPEYAKVGKVSVASSVLPGDLEGALYLGESKPGDKYRVLIVADGYGLHIKLPGSVRMDSTTGQVTATFEGLPQFPFEEFNMRFFGAERGLLVTPERCGSYAVNSRFVPWNSELPEQSATQFFVIDSGPDGTACPGSTREFAPDFSAGAVRNTAGAHAPAWIQLERRDGNQFFDAIDVSMPQGWSAVLRGVPYCPESAIAAVSSGLVSGLSETATPACPAASRIGSIHTSAGSGSAPVSVGGNAYLAGPYKGSPLSMLLTVPAVSGPYDLGVVAVRAAVKVDPVTARITAVSDPITSILDGIPLRVRWILINLDRPDFALNPTGCDKKSADARLVGSEGTEATRSTHFEVANCARLGFGPKLSLKLKGAKKRAGHPALEATLTAGKGEANLSRAQVLLPSSTLFENANMSSICNRVQYAAEQCPAGSVYGTALAYTSLLDEPIQGNVYLRASGRTLPDLVADLRGQVRFELSAQIDSIKQRLRTTFNGIPDVPVEKFVLQMKGGKKSLLVNSVNVCKVPQRATVRFVAQNRRVAKLSPGYSGCGKKPKKSSLRKANSNKGVTR